MPLKYLGNCRQVGVVVATPTEKHNKRILLKGQSKVYDSGWLKPV
jgi:hypothetical protein